MELPWEVACAHYQLALWGVHTKAEEELSSEAERRAHVSAASAPSPLIFKYCSARGVALSAPG